MKIKITIHGKVVELEINPEQLSYHFKCDHDNSQLLNFISKTIDELKK